MSRRRPVTLLDVLLHLVEQHEARLEAQLMDSRKAAAMGSGEPMSSERLAEIEQRANNLEEVYQAGDGQGGFRGLGYRDVHSVTLAYHTDVPALLAEVERLRAREAALVAEREQAMAIVCAVADGRVTFGRIPSGDALVSTESAEWIEQARALLASADEQAAPGEA